MASPQGISIIIQANENPPAPMGRGPESRIGDSWMAMSEFSPWHLADFDENLGPVGVS